MLRTPYQGVFPVTDPVPEAKLPRVLNGTEALALIVGSVIGSGIFIVPSRVAQSVPSIAGIAITWVVGGLFSLAGALTLAELGAMLPSAGGPYVYLKAAFGRLAAFLFGWTEFLVIRSGSVATLSAAVALNFAQVYPAPTGLDPRIYQAGVSIIALSFVALVNVLGTKRGGLLQVVGTALKLGALGLMVVLPFVLGKASASRLAPVWPSAWDGNLFAGIMAAMVGVLWTYDGWVNIAEVAEDVDDPGKNIPQSLMRGMAILIGVYLAVTLAYHLVLPMETVAHPSAPGAPFRIVAATFSERLLGHRGLAAISLTVMASALIALNGNAMSGPRAYFAMARDGLFPAGLCRVHRRFQTPANAIIAQAVWSTILIVAGTAFLVAEPPSGLPAYLGKAWAKLHATPLYDVMYSYVIFGGTILYTATIASVFVLRRTMPDQPRPYRTWGYPLTPLIYILASGILLNSMLGTNRFESLAGLAIIALGVPAYFAFRGSSAR